MRQATFKTITDSTKLNLAGISRDFFGIRNITSKDVAGEFSQTKLHHQKIASKYQLLLVKRDITENEHNEKPTLFGAYRFDSDNQVKNHGQFESDNYKRVFESTDITKTFELNDTEANHKSNDTTPSRIDSEPVSHPGYNPAYVISDVDCLQSLSATLQSLAISKDSISSFANKPPLEFEFVYPLETFLIDVEGSEKLPKHTSLGKLAGGCLNEQELDNVIIESESNPTLDFPTLDYDRSKDTTNIEDIDSMTAVEEFIGDESIKNEFDDSAFNIAISPEENTNAFAYINQIRSREIEPTASKLKVKMDYQQPSSISPITKLDSKGFHDYTYQVPNWPSILRKDILCYIKNSILYHNYNILAINKPYGLPSYNPNRSLDKLDINNLLHELASELRVNNLYLAHRLDKTTTGVLIFATSKEKANILNKQFRSSDIKKKYWCITKGTPDPGEGIIDMPIAEQRISGKSRMITVSEADDGIYQLAHKFREARRAITQYRVLKSVKGVALVEVEPRTGVKHQIRCHLGFGLNKPILGDHKYSHPGKLAPQSLSVPVLNALHLRQPKTRTLPVHLHSKSIMIPNAKANGENLFIHAPLPQHFSINMKSLGLIDHDIRTML